MDFEVLIVGGGPAGSSTALELVRAGVSTLLVERSDYAAPRLGEGLPPVGHQALSDLGLRQHLGDGVLLPSHGVRSAWGTSALHDRCFVRDPYGTGSHLDRGRFDALLSRVAEDRGATVLRRTRLSSIHRSASGLWKGDLLSAAGAPRTVRVRYLVDATGRSGGLSRRLGGRRLRFDRLVGVARRFTAAGPETGFGAYTLVEATEHGWWYSNPLPGGDLLVVFMTDADVYQGLRKSGLRKCALRESGDVLWEQLLPATRHTRARAGSARCRPGLRVRPAFGARLSRAAGDGWLAVGDAAAAFDPLSSQGICFALRSGMGAAAAIVADRDGCRDAFESYSETVRLISDDYRRRHREHYLVEERWPRAPFWQRRRSGSALI